MFWIQDGFQFRNWIASVFFKEFRTQVVFYRDLDIKLLQGSDLGGGFRLVSDLEGFPGLLFYRKRKEEEVD
jgi:hypothetical protein